MSQQAYVFPAAFAQQRLWFLSQLMPDSPFYNLHAAIPLSTVDEGALRRTLHEIVRRHETLRTRFVVMDGAPMQVVAPELEIPLPTDDLRHLSPSERQAEVVRLATDESRRPFDLARGPLIRTRLLRLAEREHVLLITLHHVISDGWSMGVLFTELREIYTAFASGRPSPLPELAIQYADFAVWQREWLQGAVLEEQLGYWRDRLAGLPALELPTDHRRPAVASFRGASHTFELPRHLDAGVQALARAEGCTPFMVLLAAFKVMLARYTGQDDLVVGAPIANRNRAEIEPLIGFFVNTLVLRTDLSGDPPFTDLLARVREVTLGAYAHQDLPFEKLVEELQPERDLSRNPLFQVTFQLHNAPPVAQAAAAADGRGGAAAIDVQRGTSNFDLAFDVWQGPDGLVGRFDYSTDLFDAPTMVRMAEHYRTLLAGIVADPEARASRLPMLGDEERRRLLADWNGTDAAYPRDASIHALFAETAARRPDAVAVDDGMETLTYAELGRRADIVARRLRAQGVGADALVGICMERSAGMIVGVLGILKAGGAYVALDPAYPRQRLEMLAADAGISVLVTEGRHRELLEGMPIALLCLDEIGSADADLPALESDRGAEAEGLAYVAYTSGSTGRPKGVSVTHRAVVRLVRENGYVAWAPDERVLHYAPLSFDASTFEIWGALLNGGRIVIPPPGPLSLEELGRVLVHHQVTTAWLTAGLFHQMVDEQLPALAGVRQLLAGGDVLSPHHLRTLLSAPGARRVVNGYGPTENTTFTCCHGMSAPDEVGDPVPIGRPIANTRVYVLDRNGDLAPAGVPGELYVGGDGLARGYLGRPGLTAAAFVPHPFHSGERLYRTGDRVRHRPGGVLEFMGRMDRQVKIRGFRVEPGEVESVLGQHPDVGEAAVVASAGAGGGQLVAYLVPRNGRTPADAELRGFLQARVPGWLVPAHFVVLESLPLTPNGKLDRARLPEPGAGPAEDRYAPPESEVEEALVKVWEQVLKRERIGVHDHFFTELGGHSLLGTQVISRVREAFGVELPLRRLFECPTVAQLALAVEDAILDELEGSGGDEMDGDAVEEGEPPALHGMGAAFGVPATAGGFA